MSKYVDGFAQVSSTTQTGSRLTSSAFGVVNSPTVSQESRHD
jgi:hypothetical protein